MARPIPRHDHSKKDGEDDGVSLRERTLPPFVLFPSNPIRRAERVAEEDGVESMESGKVLVKQTGHIVNVYKKVKSYEIEGWDEDE